MTTVSTESQPLARHATAARPRAGRRRWLYPWLLTATGALAVASIMFGRGDVSDPALRDTLIELRAYRLAAAFLTGAGLSVAGVFVQGLFRNPLASPSILGTTAGASLGGQLALMLYGVLLGSAGGVTWPALLMPIGCICGSLIALGILMLITRRHDDLVLLLLTGFILTSLFLGIGNFVMSLAQESWSLGRAMVAFVLGGLGGTGREQVLTALPLVASGGAAAWFWGRSLDVMLSGEEEAASLGVDVAAVRRWSIVWTSVLTAAAVSLAGNVGFVGLIVPHAMRGLVGVQHRRLIPAAALAGGGFVALCDLATRVIPSRSEIPLGVITGLVGAPLFLGLLLKGFRAEDHG